MKKSTRVITSLVTPLLLLGSNVALSASAPTGYIIMRAYVPHNDNIAQVPLPSLTFEYGNGTSKVIKPCPAPVGVLSEIANYFTNKQPDCAWFLVVGGDRRLDPNVAMPDTSSTYWVTSFSPMEDKDPKSENHLKRVVIKGEYPNARYLSFNTYQAYGAKVTDTEAPPTLTSSLPDFRINPDSGSINPWQQKSQKPVNTPMVNTYTVNVVRSSDYNPSSNALLMPPAIEGGIKEIIDEMPNFSCSNSSDLDVIQLCNNKGFSRPKEGLLSSLFPNNDSAYLMNIIQPDINTVWVINGKLPRTVKGGSPVIWPDRTNYDLRYFSVCNNIMVKPYPVAAKPLGERGCLREDQLTLTEGKYTIVVGDVIPKIGHNRLPVFNLAYNGLLVRNMVPHPEFNNSILSVTADSLPSSAISAMREFYPQIKKCTRASYLLKGADCN